MIKISKLADYSVVILASMAESSDKVLSTPMLSALTKLPEPTVSKILKLLSQSEIVISTRGINGGYRLAYKPSDIFVEQIIRAIDGPISIAACADGSEPDCSLGSACAVRGRWDDVNTAIREVLERVSLAEMLENSLPLCSAMRKGGEK